MKYFHPWILNEYYHSSCLTQYFSCKGCTMHIKHNIEIFFSEVFAFKFQQHLKKNSFLLFLLKEKSSDTWGRIIGSSSQTFWTLTWAPVLLGIYIFYLLLTWRCNNKPLLCGHGPETLWISVKHLWALERIRSHSWLGGAAFKHCREQAYDTIPWGEALLERNNLYCSCIKIPRRKKMSTAFSECRRRSPGEEGDVWIPGPGRLYWLYTEIILLLFKALIQSMSKCISFSNWFWLKFKLKTFLFNFK